MRGERELQELARQQGGYVTSRQARSVGLSSHDILRLPPTGRWLRVTPRLLRLAGAPSVPGERLHAALLDEGAGAAVDGESAAWWWGLPGFSAREVQLVTATNRARRTDLAEVHQVRVVPDRWVTELRGVRIVRPELMLVRLCATLHPLRAERALDNAWNARLLSGRSIDLLLADLGRSGRNGIGVLRELRGARTGDYVPPASNLERRATDVLAPLNLRLVRQVDSGGPARWHGRVDLRLVDHPVVLEVQSEKYHSALVDRAADEERRQGFERDGYRFVEITDDELWTQPEVVRTRVAGAVREARALAG